VRAVSSNGAVGTRAVTINNTIINTVNCAPGAPRAGDTFVQKYTTKTGVYLGPRSITASAPDNPLFRDLDDVQATLSYTAGTGSLIELRTTAASELGVRSPAGIPTSPGQAWKGAVPLPVWGGHLAAIRTPSGTGQANGSDVYVYNADGSVNSAPKRPGTSTKVPFQSGLLPVREFLPSDWQAQIAKLRDSQGTTAGNNITTFASNFRVIIRKTGGSVGDLNFSESGGTTGGATYAEEYYNVQAKFEGFAPIPTTAPTTTEKGGATSSSNPLIDRAGVALSTANGKLQYGNFCKISYTFRKVNNSNAGTTQETADATAWNGTAPFKADTSASCTGSCALAKSTIQVRNGPSDAMGDWMGTYYSHDKLPRIGTNFMTAIGRSGGQNAKNGNGTSPQGNTPYYSKKEGNNVANDTPAEATPPSSNGEILQTITRVQLP
jgi:hypothetical protein